MSFRVQSVSGFENRPDVEFVPIGGKFSEKLGINGRFNFIVETVAVEIILLSVKFEIIYL